MCKLRGGFENLVDFMVAVGRTSTSTASTARATTTTPEKPGVLTGHDSLLWEQWRCVHAPESCYLHEGQQQQ